MNSGKAVLILPSGRGIPLDYQFADDTGLDRAGYLVCDTSTLDPAVFCHKLRLRCDDGSLVELAVSHSTGRYLAFVGRVLPNVDAAA